MIWTFLALTATAAKGTSRLPPELRASVTAILQCASAKDLHCLARHAADPSALRVTFHNGKRGWNPSLYDAVSDHVPVNLFHAAVQPNQITYRAYNVGHSRYDVVFYKVGALPRVATLEEAGRITSVHCYFQKILGRWRLTNSICGYVDTD
jgi:hypothetical protein